MFLVEIKFEVQEPVEGDAQIGAVWSLLGSLVHGGNLHDNFSFGCQSFGWVAYGSAPAKDAFKKQSLTRFALQSLKGFKGVKLKHPHFRFVGKVPETASSCRCIKPKGYILFTTFMTFEPPVRCIRCGGTVALYRLSCPPEGEHFKMLSWESNYKACDTLYMQSSVGEEFGKRQMSDVNSSLSRSGLAICKELESRMRRPFYYYLNNWSRNSNSTELGRRCPGCGSVWLLKEPLHGKFDFKCDRCHLLSNISWHVR